MTDTYFPPQNARLLGGLQWAFTAMIIVSTIATLYFTYLMDIQNGIHTFSYAREAVVAMAIAFGMGYFWVACRTKNERQEIRANRQRVDYLLILWLGWPCVYFGLANLFQFVNIDVLNRLYIGDAVLGFGDVLFTVFVVYHLKIEIVVRFISR